MPFLAADNRKFILICYHRYGCHTSRDHVVGWCVYTVYIANHRFYNGRNLIGIGNGVIFHTQYQLYQVLHFAMSI